MRFFIFAFLLLVSASAQAQVSIDTNTYGGGIRPGWSSSACDSTTAGAIRYNSGTTFNEYCNGTTWTSFRQGPQTDAVTAPSGSGYFVLTQTTWDGNLGGMAGANAKCFTELSSTHTTWKGYATALSNGQVTTDKISAFVCVNQWGACNGPMPLTTYYFAYAGNATPGGGSFTTDAYGLGPYDTADWSDSSHFGGVYQYWTGNGTGARGTWTNWGGSGYAECQGWLENQNFVNANIGDSTNSVYTYERWNKSGSEASCDQTLRLVCLVNP